MTSKTTSTSYDLLETFRFDQEYGYLDIFTFEWEYEFKYEYDFLDNFFEFIVQVRLL